MDTAKEKCHDSKIKQKARSISKEEETLRNTTDEECQQEIETGTSCKKTKSRGRATTSKSEDECNNRNESRRRQKARQRRRFELKDLASDFTRGDVDDIMENFVDQWTQCAPKVRKYR